MHKKIYFDYLNQQEAYMLYAKLLLRGILLGAFIVSSVQAMVYDNRYFPLLKRPFLIADGRPSHFASNVFLTTASKAVGPADEDIGIPELFGKFNLLQLSMAITKLGLPNPEPSQVRFYEFPFRVEGVIQSQGVEFAYEQAIGDYFKLGVDCFFMRSVSRQEFFPDITRLFGIDPIEIDDIRRAMFQEVGMTQAVATQFGFSDLDIYARVGYTWDYTLKFRRIDAGARFGLLGPTGVQRSICSPASVPFGGNGFWGLYGQLDLELEAKEDMSVGAMFRFSKRIPKVKNERLSVEGEPIIFGATTGLVKEYPGFTFVFDPYICLENLRGGLGVRVLYTLTKHYGDVWCDARCDQTVPVQLSNVPFVTQWESDYFTLNVFYDFGKVKVERGLDPILYFAWDIPSLMFSSDRSVTTHRISLGIELNF